LLVIDGWIDDMALGASKGAKVDAFLNELNNLLPIKVNILSHFLGMLVLRDRRQRVLQIGQAAYIQSLAGEFGVGNRPIVDSEIQPVLDGVVVPRSHSTPMEHGTVLPLIPKDPTPSQLQASTPALLSAYRRLLGGLLYIANVSRPDVSYAVSYLARFARLPTTVHFTALLRVLAYLYNSRFYYLTFKSSSSTPTLSGYADATWVGKQGMDELSRSTSGYVFFLGGGPISWRSAVQRRPALSSTDAEFVAASEAAREAVTLRTELQELGFGQTQPTSLFEDNQGCVETAKNGSVGSGLKHILLREHYLLWASEEKQIAMKRVATADNLADLFTKPLPPSQHLALASHFLAPALRTSSL
jgi:hypothetical protein